MCYGCVRRNPFKLAFFVCRLPFVEGIPTPLMPRIPHRHIYGGLECSCASCSNIGFTSIAARKRGSGNKYMYALLYPLYPHRPVIVMPVRGIQGFAFTLGVGLFTGIVVDGLVKKLEEPFCRYTRITWLFLVGCVDEYLTC